MPNRTQLGRADLLVCLQEYGEADLDALAGVLGYERREPERAISLPVIEGVIGAELDSVTLTVSETPAAVPKARFHRVVAHRQLKPEEVIRDVPDWYRSAKPFRPDEIRADPNARPPPHQPLMPWSVRWWDRELSCLFYPVCWDRSLRPPRRLGARRPVAIPAQRADSDEGAETLLALLALAIRVEPALLRAVRYLLPARDADVGSEAAAWNHEHVHATPLAFYYDSDNISKYRTSFSEHEEGLLRDVAKLIVDHHKHLSPTIGTEEKLLLAKLSGTHDAEAQRDMERMVATLSRGEGILVEAARAWVQRLTPRQHEAMWENDILKAVWAAANLSQLKKEEISLPKGLELAGVAWLFGQELALRCYVLRQRGQALCFEPEGGSVVKSELDAPGSLLAEIRAAVSTVQIQRIAADAPSSDESSQPLDREILLSPTDALRLRTDHDELIIDSIDRPGWAEAIGRDEYGLYADFCVEGVYQRMRWIAPGEFLMGSPEDEPGRFSNETQHPVILTKGYWLADTACTQALWQAVMGNNPSSFKGNNGFTFGDSYHCFPESMCGADRAPVGLGVDHGQS